MSSSRRILIIAALSAGLAFATGSRAEEGQSLLAAALEAAKGGEIEKAVSLYDELLSLESIANDVKVAAYNNRGVIYDDLGLLDAALKDFSAALLLDPSSSEAYNNRGITFAKSGKMDRAITDFDRALFLSPDDPEVYSNRAVAYGKLGHLEAALRDFNRALRLRKDDAVTLYNRALLHLEMGNEQKARADLESASSLSPGNETIARKFRDLGWDEVSPAP